MLQIVTKSVALRRATMPAAIAGARRQYADDQKPSSDNTDGGAKPDAKKTVDQPAAVAGTSNRLNQLLASMSTDSNLDIVKTVVAAAKPRKTDAATSASKRPIKHKSGGSVVTAATGEQDSIERAAHDVAASLGGDVQRTESELLAKLLHRAPADGNAGAAGDVNAGGSPKISDLLSGMQIDRLDAGKSSIQPRRAQFVRKSIEYAQERRSAAANGNGGGEQGERRPFQRRKSTLDPKAAAANAASVNLFGEQPLGIFLPHINELQSSAVDPLPTWALLQARDLQLAITHPPANHFQKMAQWTEQGKLWRFPIDNEQGLDAEAAVCFTEHIFLDRHLEGWCPPRGPVRHFMELVCVGLSKNAFYTVAQKVEHIEWYRRYFEEKRELLQQVIIDQTTTTAANATAPKVDAGGL